MDGQTLDPWLPLPQAPAAAKVAGVPVSYTKAYRAASAGEFFTLREGRAILAFRPDFLRWAAGNAELAR